MPDTRRKQQCMCLLPCNCPLFMQHPAFKTISALFKESRVSTPLPGKL